MNQENKNACSVHRITASFTEHDFSLVVCAIQEQSFQAICKYDEWASCKDSIIRAGMDEIDYYKALSALARKSNELHELYQQLHEVYHSYRDEMK